MGSKAVAVCRLRTGYGAVACGVVLAGMVHAAGPVTAGVSPATISKNGITTVTGTFTNMGATTDTGFGFSLFGPSSLVIANPANATNTCGGFILATPGSTNASTFSGSVAPGVTCTFSTDFTASATGSDNVFAEATWSGGGAASAETTLTVTGPTGTLSPSLAAAGVLNTFVITANGCNETPGNTVSLNVFSGSGTTAVTGIAIDATHIAFQTKFSPSSSGGETGGATVSGSSDACNGLTAYDAVVNYISTFGGTSGSSNRTWFDTSPSAQDSWSSCGSCHSQGVSPGQGGWTAGPSAHGFLSTEAGANRVLNWAAIENEVHDFGRTPAPPLGTAPGNSLADKSVAGGTSDFCTGGSCVPQVCAGLASNSCSAAAPDSSKGASVNSTPGQPAITGNKYARYWPSSWTLDNGRTRLNGRRILIKLGPNVYSDWLLRFENLTVTEISQIMGILNNQLPAPTPEDVQAENIRQAGLLASTLQDPGATEDIYINLNTGNSADPAELMFPGRKLLIDFETFYNSLDAYTGPLGIGWTHTYNVVLVPNGPNAVIKEGDGQEIPWTGAGGGAFTPGIPGVLDTLRQNADSTYTLTRRSHVQLNFSVAGQLTSITDPNGNTQTLTYTSGNLTTVTDNSGRTLTFTFDSSNHITSVADPLGRTEQFAYDGFNRLITYTDPAGGVTQYSYDADNRIIQLTDPRGNNVILTYDAQGRAASRTDAAGFTTTYAYNTPSTGITTKTDPLSNVTKFAFDTQGRINSITNTLGGVSSVTYDSNNMILTSTDQLGRVWNYAYDASSDLIQATDPLGGLSKYTWDSNFNLLTATDPLAHTTSYNYDSKDNLTQITNAAGGTASYTYDPTGLPLTYTNADGAVTSYTYDTAGDLIHTTDALGKIWKYTYDAVGRRLTFTDPLSNTTTYTYDNLNNLTKVTDPLGHFTTFTYDPNSNLTSITDANAHVTQYAYDVRNQLSTTTDALNDVANSAYDGNGNLSGYSDFAGHMMLNAYDGLNRRIKVTDPLGNTNLYSYDAVGNLTGLTDGNGKTNAFVYDALNRQTAANLFDATSITYSYDADSDLTGMIDFTGTSTYGYDVLNRLTSATSGDGATVGLGYDAVGNRTSLTLPNLTVDTYTYDKRNEMITAMDGAGAKTTYVYDAAGRMTKANLANGASSIYKYDAASRLVSVTNKAAGGTTNSSFSYVFDAVGNKLQVTSGKKITMHTYDAVNRLVSSTPSGGAATTYTYDAAANRLSVIATATTNYTYDIANRMTAAGGAALTSDNNGNLLNDGTLTYHYDALNRLTSVKGGKVNATYQYDGFGRRVQQNAGTTMIHYVNDPVTGQVLTESGTAAMTYFSGMGLISATGATELYYQYDGSDNVASVSGSTGALVTNYTYQDWGQAKASVAGVVNRYQFAAVPIDPETSFIYMEGRYYRPSYGRFISTQGTLGGSPDLYLYLNSNPVQ